MGSSKKIREYTDFFTVLGIIVVCIVGLVVFISGLKQNSSLIALLAIVGTLVAIMWLMLQKWLLYGFADLIDNTRKIAYPEIHKEKIEKKESGENSISEKAKISTDKLARNLGTCDVCKKENVSVRKATIKKGDTKQDGYICDECLEKNNVKIV